MVKGKLLLSSYEQLCVVQYKEKLAGDLLLGLKFAKLEILYETGNARSEFHNHAQNVRARHQSEV